MSDEANENYPRNGKRTTIVLPESYDDAILELIAKKWVLNKSSFIRLAVYNELKTWFGRELKKEKFKK